MPFEAEQGIVAAHPHPVIPDTHQAPPARLDLDLDPCRAGVQRILDQLLNYAGRPLNDLSSRDLVGYLLG